MRSKAKTVNEAGVQGKSTYLPGEVCVVSLKGLRGPRCLLTTAQKSAEGIVPARCYQSAGKARTLSGVSTLNSSRPKQRRQTSPDRGPGGKAKAVKPLGSFLRAEQSPASTTNKG